MPQPWQCPLIAADHEIPGVMNSRNTLSRTLTLATLAFLCLVTPALAQEPKKARQAGPPKPAPDLANFKYGPHQRNVLDLWKAKSDAPTPLVVFIHGGGFRGGSKEGLSPTLLDGCLKAGISVMAINYRLSPEVSFPAHYMDSARAIQTARLHATEWNLDPKRVASTGGSAGAGTSLWIGFHDDLADPKSDDPVLRQSTRLTCMAVNGAQSTYDPRTIKEWVGGRAHEHPALQGFFGLKSDELDSPKAHKVYEASAPITHLTRDDPPVYAFYNEMPRGAMPENSPPGAGIHHINFGLRLKERMDKLGIECIVKHQQDGVNGGREELEFLVKHLKPSAGSRKQP